MEKDLCSKIRFVCRAQKVAVAIRVHRFFHGSNVRFQAIEISRGPSWGESSKKGKKEKKNFIQSLSEIWHRGRSKQNLGENRASAWLFWDINFVGLSLN